MTDPVGTQTSGAQDVAERVARVLWERATGQTWSPDMADGPSPTLVATAREWVDLFRAAGLTVAEQPPAADRMVLSGPLRALAVEWSRAGRRLRDTGGDVAVADAFEQHGELLLELLGESVRERQS